MKLCVKQKYNAGRNGILLCRSKGNKIKKLYRLIDFNLNFFYINPFIFLKIISDPNRNNKLILVLNLSGFLFYILAAHQVKIPMVILSFSLLNGKIGLPQLLGNLVEGSFLFNFRVLNSLTNNIARSAGTYGQLLKKQFRNSFNLIRLRNGVKLIVSSNIMILQGINSNIYYHNLIKGKAGKNRNLGFRPIVRGIAKNPIDHPNGGRTPGGKVYRSFSGNIARSTKKTRKKQLQIYAV